MQNGSSIKIAIDSRASREKKELKARIDALEAKVAKGLDWKAVAARLTAAKAAPDASASAAPAPVTTPETKASAEEPATGRARVRRALEREMADWGQRGCPVAACHSADMDAINADLNARAKSRRNKS